jgi:hypothetical protein
MKTISIFFIAFFTALVLSAQNTNTVTIKLNSNRYQGVIVDGKTYPVTNVSNTGTEGTVIITGLQPGQHELQVVRVNQNNARRTNSRAFNLRSRYDLAITVNNDGSIALQESRNRTFGSARRNSSAMTDAEFSTLLQTVEGQRRANSKTTAVTNAFENTNNYFTTDQVTQLLEYVSSESKRLSLAKSVYPRITDPANFSLIYDLFDNQANKDALADYVSNYNSNRSVYNNRNTNNNRNSNYNQVAMTDADFNVLMKDVKKQWLPGAKMNSLTSAFSNTNNYFTTYQAKQLIQLVSDEDNRLQLAKSVYGRIIDPANFSQLYDLFSSQARRDELKSYINSYSYNNRY